MLCWLVFPIQGQSPVSYVRPAHVVPSTVRHVGNHDHLPVIIEDELILLPGQLGNVRGYFVLDTGSPSLIVNSRLINGSGARISGQSVDGGAVMLREVSIPELTFRNRTHRDVQALALDLSHLDAYTGKNILGLLGRDWLDVQPFLFNPHQKHVLFLDELSQKEKLAETVTTFSNLEHIPVISLQFGGIHLKFGIDSGSSRSLFHGESLRKLSGVTKTVVDQIDLQGLNQEVHRTEIVAISDIRISPEADPIMADFVVADMSSLQKLDGADLDGLIGLDFLKRYIFSVDYQKGKMYWWGLK